MTVLARAAIWRVTSEFATALIQFGLKQKGRPTGWNVAPALSPFGSLSPLRKLGIRLLTGASCHGLLG